MHDNNAYGDELLRGGKAYFCANGIHDGLLLGSQVYVEPISISATHRKESKDVPGLLLLEGDLKKSDMTRIFECHRSRVGVLEQYCPRFKNVGVTDQTLFPF